MKTKLLLLFFVLASFLASAQSNNKEIETQFMSYLNTIIAKDFNKAMDYAPDGLFEIVPKEQLVSVMEKVFNNPEIEIHIKDPKVLSVGESVKIKGKHYALLTYSNVLAMKFNNADAETEEERQARVKVLKMSFEQGFGEGKVKYDEETEVFDIYTEKQVYAISNDGNTEWKFLVIEEKQKPILDKFLPKQLIKKIDFSKG